VVAVGISTGMQADAKNINTNGVIKNRRDIIAR
jgi:hypothetical protein